MSHTRLIGVGLVDYSLRAQKEIVRPVFWGRVKTAIYEASDTKNVSLTHYPLKVGVTIFFRSFLPQSPTLK